jgi:voltage-gated potassium channel Kch
MAVSQSSEALRRPWTMLRLGFSLVALGALVLGYIGLGEFVVRAPGPWGRRGIDLTYYDIQLFVLGSDPLQDPGPYPWALECARFLAPTVTLYAVVETARLLLSVELSRLRARRARDHVIVCGDTEFAEALSRRFQAKDVHVVDIRSMGDDFVTKGEPLRIVGDGRDPAVLRAAGVQGARAVYALTATGAENAAIALAVARLRRRETSPVFVHGHIPDPDLCATLQASVLGWQHDGGVQLAFFNIDQIAARRIFSTDPVTPVSGGPPHLVVTEASTFATAVLVAAARSWRVNRLGGVRLPVTLVGRGSVAAAAAASRRYPFFDDVCEVLPYETDLLTLLTEGPSLPLPDRVIICGEDEELALKTAMAAQRVWRRRSFRLLVRLEGLATYVGENGVTSRADPISGRLMQVYGLISSTSDPELIQNDLVDQLAQVIHDRYRQGRRERGEWAAGHPALEPWDQLSSELQRANRSQANAVGRTLAQLNCMVAPRIGVDEEATLSKTDVEQLAVYEHERWCRERETAGWRYSDRRSDEDKLHPGLVPWAALPEELRHRTRHAVRDLADVLADAGFRIIRR